MVEAALLRFTLTRTWGLVALHLAVGLGWALGGCSQPRSVPGASGAAPDAQTSRYWLQNVTLFEKPGGKEICEIKGPVQADAFTDGRVRSIPGADQVFEGYVSEALLREPGERQGLMLYVQRAADLHFTTPSGPIIGKLHPGAYVSVAQTDANMVRVGLGFGKYGPRVAYASRDALGPEPRARLAPASTGPGVALVTTVDFWFVDPTTGDETCVAGDPCRDVFVTPDGRASQAIEGVELEGKADVRRGGPRTYVSTVLCAANAVSRHANRLFLTGPTLAEVEIDRIPDTHVPVELPRADPLGGVISKGGSVYWLEFGEGRPLCSEWRFQRGRVEARPTRVVGISRLQEQAAPGGHTVASASSWYPVEYQLSDGTTPAQLKLDCRQPCNGVHFEYLYTLLGAQADTLTMMPYRIPDKIVSYDPAQAERWFLSRSACETSAEQSAETIRQDPRTTTRLGFHIREE